MPENLDPRNLDEYLLNKLEGLPSATRRVIVLDPSGIVNLGEELSFNSNLGRLFDMMGMI